MIFFSFFESQNIHYSNTVVFYYFYFLFLFNPLSICLLTEEARNLQEQSGESRYFSFLAESLSQRTSNVLLHEMLSGNPEVNFICIEK